MEEELREPTREGEGDHALMPIVTFDTFVFIAYKPAELPAGFRMSAVVVQVMTAGAINKKGAAANP
jgi:hypothetical protein